MVGAAGSPAPEHRRLHGPSSLPAGAAGEEQHGGQRAFPSRHTASNPHGEVTVWLTAGQLLRQHTL